MTRRRVGTKGEPYEHPRHSKHRSPHRPVWSRLDAVERRVDALVLLWIERLIRLDVFIAPAIAIGIEDERRPALRQLFIFRFEVNACVEPALDGTAAGEPEDVLAIEVQVMGAKTGVDRDDLFRLRVVHLHLPSALIDRERLRRGVIRPLAAERRCLIGTDARGHPHARLVVHREAMRGGLGGPD